MPNVQPMRNVTDHLLHVNMLVNSVYISLKHLDLNVFVLFTDIMEFGNLFRRFKLHNVY